MSAPLEGVRVLDLSRILAGPSCTQILGDLGCDVVKVERPGRGDDTRAWGPPFVRDAEGRDTAESAYYLAANRNKRSLTVDLAHPEGRALVRRLALRADVLVENFKVGDLARHGLDFASLHAAHPKLVYASITGFGQTGPRASEAGYDFLVQAMGGVMSLTGEPDGAPMKVGVGVADVVCGLYATIGILAALSSVQRGGEGQHVDVALFDAQLAWLVNAATQTLLTGTPPPRLGNGHPTIVPYETFATADGYVALAIGNDDQFARFCALTGIAEVSSNPSFATNRARVAHRDACRAHVGGALVKQTSAHWLGVLVPAGIPCGPVNDVRAALSNPQALARAMRVVLPHAASGTGTVELVGSPLKLSATPVSYRAAPPSLGADSRAVLRDWLSVGDGEFEALRGSGAL